MLTFPTPAPDMSDRQHEALTAGKAHAEGWIGRSGRFTVPVLKGLVARRWATLVWETVNVRGVPTNRVAGATVLSLGLRDLVLVDRDRAQAERDAAVRKLSFVLSAPDPFAVFARKDELEIPF